MCGNQGDILCTIMGFGCSNHGDTCTIIGFVCGNYGDTCTLIISELNLLNSLVQIRKRLFIDNIRVKSLKFFSSNQEKSKSSWEVCGRNCLSRFYDFC